MQELESIIHYKFKNQALLQQSLRHASVVFDVVSGSGNSLASKNDRCVSNERLEFLGDAVLDLFISDQLYKMLDKDEGALSRYRSHLVNKDSLVKKATKIRLGEFINLGKSQSRSGVNDSLVANAFEALIGAVYLDSDSSTVFEMLSRLFEEDLQSIKQQKWQDKDFKTMLQEVVQAEHKKAPYYEEISCVGPDHSRTFTVAALFEGKLIGKGSGLSKKLAEQLAAKQAYEKLAPSSSRLQQKESFNL